MGWEDGEDGLVGAWVGEGWGVGERHGGQGVIVVVRFTILDMVGVVCRRLHGRGY